MITLVSVLESWRRRFSLSDDQWLELAEQVSLTVDLAEHHYPPMPIDLADRIGVRTFDAAVTKVLKERLLGGLPGQEYPEPSPISGLRPEPVEVKILPKPRRNCCSHCQGIGHNVRSCPIRRFP